MLYITTIVEGFMRYWNKLIMVCKDLGRVKLMVIIASILVLALLVTILINQSKIKGAFGWKLGQKIDLTDCIEPNVTNFCYGGQKDCIPNDEEYRQTYCYVKPKKDIEIFKELKGVIIGVQFTPITHKIAYIQIWLNSDSDEELKAMIKQKYKGYQINEHNEGVFPVLVVVHSRTNRFIFVGSSYSLQSACQSLFVPCWGSEIWAYGDNNLKDMGEREKDKITANKIKKFNNY